jgi:4-amino-4-deoxy-L-arabinose transferase-like glycosyltransferase
LSSSSVHTRRAQIALLLVLLLAFGLRVYRLDVQPLRGDEAFAVRYWAQPPAAILDHLAWVEPHPFGTFFGFWAWQSLVGESEFAMRMLSALPNVLGAAGIYALARRMGRRAEGYQVRLVVPLLAALLWTINPNLIWHSQDARNYAAWAGLSVVALWLFLRAVERGRRIDWLLYIAVETLTLYVFFLEAFMLIVHGAYVLAVYGLGRGEKGEGEMYGRAIARPYSRQVIGRWVAALGVILLLLIPWFYQGYRLATSGYGGTASATSLLTWLTFITELLYEPMLDTYPAQFFWGLEGFVFTPLLALIAVMWWFGTQPFSKKRAAWYPPATLTLLMFFLPPLLLAFVSTRLDVFRARYVIAITPALLLLLAWVLIRLKGDFNTFGAWLARPFTIMFFGIVVLASGIVLSEYYAGNLPKSPDWRALGAYLQTHLTPDEALLVTAGDQQGSVDPAFQYYYEGAFTVLPRTTADTEAEAEALLVANETVYLLDGGGSDLGNVLQARGAYLGERWVGRGLRVSYFRSDDVHPDEITQPLALTVTGRRLVGWSSFGSAQAGEVYSVLLYWDDPIVDVDWKVFLHLVNANGDILAQADRVPRFEAGRDVYPLTLDGVPAGTYTLRFGMYNEETSERAPIRVNGDVIGDVTTLGEIQVGG